MSCCCCCKWCRKCIFHINSTSRISPYDSSCFLCFDLKRIRNIRSTTSFFCFYLVSTYSKTRDHTAIGYWSSCNRSSVSFSKGISYTWSIITDLSHSGSGTAFSCKGNYWLNWNCFLSFDLKRIRNIRGTTSFFCFYFVSTYGKTRDHTAIGYWNTCNSCSVGFGKYISYTRSIITDLSYSGSGTAFSCKGNYWLNWNCFLSFDLKRIRNIRGTTSFFCFYFVSTCGKTRDHTAIGYWSTCNRSSVGFGKYISYTRSIITNLSHSGSGTAFSCKSYCWFDWDCFLCFDFKVIRNIRGTTIFFCFYFVSTYSKTRDHTATSYWNTCNSCSVGFGKYISYTWSIITNLSHSSSGTAFSSKGNYWLGWCRLLRLHFKLIRKCGSTFVYFHFHFVLSCGKTCYLTTSLIYGKACGYLCIISSLHKSIDTSYYIVSNLHYSRIITSRIGNLSHSRGGRHELIFDFELSWCTRGTTVFFSFYLVLTYSKSSDSTIGSIYRNCSSYSCTICFFKVVGSTWHIVGNLSHTSLITSSKSLFLYDWNYWAFSCYDFKLIRSLRATIVLGSSYLILSCWKSRDLSIGTYYSIYRGIVRGSNKAIGSMYIHISNLHHSVVSTVGSTYFTEDRLIYPCYIKFSHFTIACYSNSIAQM